MTGWRWLRAYAVDQRKDLQTRQGEAMYDESLQDPTAGERARRMRRHPDRVEPVNDPTAGERARRNREVPGAQPIVDPTDPRSGLPASSRGGLDEEPF
jgi:hypothetical protein